MPQMNGSAVRVVDPILTRHARGYRQAAMIGRFLFPIAYVNSYGGKVIEFGKDSFRLYNSKRAPGANVKRVRVGYEGKPFAIVAGALDAQVPREHMTDAANVPGINLATRAVNKVLRAMALEHEWTCAQIAHTAANYDNNHKMALVGDSRWTSPDSDPISDIATGREAIRASIGVRPNLLELSAQAYTALTLHPALLARAADTTIKDVTIDLMKVVFQVKNIVVGEATVATDSSDTLGDVWGDSAVLAYVAEVETDLGGDIEEPSYGYTYRIEDHPMVEEPRWDGDTRSWVYGVTDDNSPVLSGMTAGFLFQNAGGAPA